MIFCAFKVLYHGQIAHTMQVIHKREIACMIGYNPTVHSY